jgi:hypothetical protein
MYRLYEEPPRPRTRPKPVLRSYWPFWLISVLHILIAQSCKFGAGVGIPASSPGEKQSYLDQFAHGPVLDVYSRLLVRLFHPNHLEWMHHINIVIGGCIPGMVGVIVWRITRNKFGGLLAGFIFALNPSLLLYEAYWFYAILAAFLVTASVFCLAMFCPNRRNGWLYGFVALVNLLIMTMGVYHLAILLVVVPFAVGLAGAKRVRAIVICLLISGVSIGLYARGHAMMPGRCWDRLETSQLEGDQPEGCFNNIASRYQNFCIPSSQYRPLSRNTEKISKYEWVASRVVQGQWLCEYLAAETDVTGGEDIFRSLLFFILPLMVLVYLLSAVRRCVIWPAAWWKMISRDPATAMAMSLIVYSTVVCVLAGFAQEMRFKFIIEPLLWSVSLGLLSRLFQKRRLAGDDRQWAGPRD